MKRFFFLSILLLVFTFAANAQRYATKNGFIRFYSEGSIEKIEATNRQVNSAFDAGTGDFVFKVLMKSFVFEKALMQEHFNENYVESDKYPNSTFIGKIANLKDLKVDKDGSYPVIVEGKLTLHGITKDITEKGTFDVKEGRLNGKAKFNILLSDYKISIPGAVTKNINNSIEITVDAVLEKATQ